MITINEFENLPREEPTPAEPPKKASGIKAEILYIFSTCAVFTIFEILSFVVLGHFGIITIVASSKLAAILFYASPMLLPIVMALIPIVGLVIDMLLSIVYVVATLCKELFFGIPNYFMSLINKKDTKNE